MTYPRADSNQLYQNDNYYAQVAISKINQFQTALTNINKKLSDLDSKVNQLLDTVAILSPQSADTVERVDKIYSAAEQNTEYYTNFRDTLLNIQQETPTP